MDINQKQPNGLTSQRLAPPARASTSARSSKASKVWWLIGGVVIALIIAGSIAYFGFGLGQHVDKNKYQAVFLANGQVYFGKLNGWGGSQPYLTEVYYLQAAGENPESGAQTPSSEENSQTLVKLGTEIHKPSDKLILNPDAILFVENIEDEGQVVRAIKNGGGN